MIDGKESYGVNVATQVIPSEYRTVLCDYSQADKATVEKAIEGSLRAKQSWENVPQAKRSAIFQRAAKLVETKYRYEVVAATMLGQGKNAWQAEIDAAAEVEKSFISPLLFANCLLSRRTFSDSFLILLLSSTGPSLPFKVHQV